jgi:imidazolonepropionase-like amidohydrolase
MSAAVVLAAALASIRGGAAHAETIALTGATVHTASRGILADATVVIADGKIVAVGAGIAPPAGATIVSCAGKHIAPGFISANTLLGLTEVQSVRATNDYREIGAINPNIAAEVQVNPESDLLPVARANGVTSALVIPRGGLVSGTSALMHLDGWNATDMTVRAPVALHVQWPARTYSFVKETRETQKKEYAAKLDTIRAAFDDARAYWKARDAEGKAGVPRHDRDVRWDAMGRALRGEIPVVFHASSLAQIRDVLDLVDAQRLPKVALLGTLDLWRVADELKQRDIAVIIAGSLDGPPRRDATYDESYTLAGRLSQAGVRFCMADGGGADDAMTARNLPYNAATGIGLGLTREEALKSITLYPAQILGVADRLGSIEPGKVADLLIADGDPLEVTTHVEQVYIAGRPTSMSNRQIRLFRKYDARPRGAKARKR